MRLMAIIGESLGSERNSHFSDGFCQLIQYNIVPLLDADRSFFLCCPVRPIFSTDGDNNSAEKRADDDQN